MYSNTSVEKCLLSTHKKPDLTIGNCSFLSSDRAMWFMQVGAFFWKIGPIPAEELVNSYR